MIKAFAVSVLGMMLCFAAPTPAASQEEPAAPSEPPAVPLENALPGDEVRKLFEGNTEMGEGRKAGLDTGRRWEAFYAADGTVRKREKRRTGSSGVKAGTWFVDAEGRNCFQWEGKEEPKCDLIIPEDGRYLRVREGQVRGLIRIQEGNPSNL
jgi:hypothetical protein